MPRSKADKEAGLLSATALKSLSRWYKKARYNREYQFSAPQTEKGNSKEDAAITLVNKVFYPDMLLMKNLERKMNDHIGGTADLVIDKDDERVIIDTKVSYSLDTFPTIFDEALNPRYKCQVNGYMALWGAKKAYVDYCLIDTPANLIDGEIWKLAKTEKIVSRDMDFAVLKDEQGYILLESDLAQKMVAELVMKHIYTADALEAYMMDSAFDLSDDFYGDFTEIPDEERIMRYEVNFDASLYEKTAQAVDRIRAFYDQKMKGK